MKSGKKRVITNILITIITIIVVLACFEIFVRIFYRNKFGPRPPFTVPSETCGWEVAPNLDHSFFGDDFVIHVKTDEHGYRLGKLGKIDLNKELILLCGDSYTFGWGVSTKETFASFFEEIIYESSNRKVRVANLAVGGYGTVNCAARLKQFKKRYPNSKIRAVIIMHVHNDMRDNVKHLGLFFKEVQQVFRPGNIGSSLRNKSRIHTINLINYVVYCYKSPSKIKYELLKARDSAHSNYMKDALHTFKLVKYELPDTIRIGDEAFYRDAIGSSDTDLGITWRRRSLTRLQEVLLLDSLKRIHCLFEESDVSIIHTMIPTSPVWYDTILARLIEESNICRNEVINVGKLSDASCFEGDILNSHSGGHYTAAFNKCWAEKAAARLAEIINQ